MKNITVFTLFFLCLQNLYAQDTLTHISNDTFRFQGARDKGWYIQADGGYSMGIGKQYFQLIDSKYVMDTASPAVEIKGKLKRTSSFGKGKTLQFVTGYNFERWGLELATAYLWGDRTSAKAEYISNSTIHPGYTNVTSYSMKVLNLNPSIRIRSRASKRINAYLSTGFVLGLFPRITDQVTSDNPLLPANYSAKTDYHGNVAWGFSSCIGGNFRLNKHFSLHGEARFLHETYSPAYKGSKKLLTSYAYNSVSGPFPGQLRSTFNLSSGGLFIGVNYLF